MKVFSRDVILDEPFSVITDYGDGETEDGIFSSVELGDGEYGWTVLQWNGSTSYVNVGGTTIPLDEVE